MGLGIPSRSTVLRFNPRTVRDVVALLASLSAALLLMWLVWKGWLWVLPRLLPNLPAWLAEPGFFWFALVWILPNIAVVLAMSAIASGPWRSLGLGVAVGLAAHFLRDMATSTAGVPLLWPMSTTGYMLPYPLYAATLAIAITWGVVTAVHKKRQGPGR